MDKLKYWFKINNLKLNLQKIKILNENTNENQFYDNIN